MTLRKTGLGDRPEWILRLLYAPVKGQKCMPIVGTTRLMKGCFLLDRRLEEEKRIETDFEFRPDKYGPLDPAVYESVEFLELEGLITTHESERYDGTEYALTSSGKSEAEPLFQQLPDDQKELICWIKGKHVLQSLSKLLSFVYNQYPSMAEKSKLA